MNISDSSPNDDLYNSRVVTVPNLLSVGRLICAILFFILGLQGKWHLAFWIFVCGAGTDLIDGTIARILRQQSRLGTFLDPMADKIMMSLSLMVLTYKLFLPLWFFVLVFARDYMMLYGVIVFKRKKITVDYQPTVTSKITTLFLVVTISWAVLKPLVVSGSFGPFNAVNVSTVFPYLLYPAGILTFITLIQYYIIGSKILREKTAKG